MTPESSAIPLTDQLAVPVAVPLPPRSEDQLTCVTPKLSEAVPARFMALVFVLKVGVETGEVMAIAGGVVSGGV